MGKRHNVLTDEIFKNSKYMKYVEKYCEYNGLFDNVDYKKEHPKEYNFMLDTFNTLILLNNCYFSDSNSSIYDRVDNAIKIMEKYLYVDCEKNNKKKYTDMFIRKIFEKQVTHIYRKINEWYNWLNNKDKNGKDRYITNKEIDTTPYIKNMKEEIELEMTQLEDVGFDEKVSDNISFQKNKNNLFKIYINKMGIFSDETEKYIKKYVKEYNAENDKKNQIDKTDVYCSFLPLFDAVAYGINGLSVKLYGNNETIIEKNGKRLEAIDYYQKLFKISLNSRMYNDYYYSFHRRFYEAWMYHNDICFNDYINDLGCYLFKHFVEAILTLDFKATEYSVQYGVLGYYKKRKSSKFNKLCDDVIEAYYCLTENNFEGAYNILINIIERNKDYFKRMW